MRLRLMVITASLLAAAALGAVVFAQLGDTQTASGSVNVSTTSADLYICEPDTTPGPDCGSDDSGDDETVFETLEDMLPGDRVEWDIRLKNVGTEDWIVASPDEFFRGTVGEIVDPGDDCPDGALDGPFPASITVLGKNGDESNDNLPEGSLPGVPNFLRESTFPSQSNRVQVKVAPGDYEDFRLRLELAVSVGSYPPISTENCDGNEWSVSWEFTVVPVSP